MGIFGNILEMAPQVGAQGFQGASAGQQIRTDRDAREAEAEARKQRAIRDEMFRQATLDLQREREERLSAPKPPEAPSYRASAGGVSTEFDSEDEARGFVDRNRPDPAEAAPTPGQAATERDRQARRIREEALGNALTWASSGQIDRNRGVQLIARQHNLPVGQASTIWDDAVQRLTMQEGRGLTNEGREKRLQDDGGTDLDRAIARLVSPEGADETPAAGPRNPLAAGRAVAAPADTGPAVPAAPEINPDFTAQIDADLGAGKTAAEVLADIEAAGLPPAMVEQARAYLSQRGGGGV